MSSKQIMIAAIVSDNANDKSTCITEVLQDIILI